MLNLVRSALPSPQLSGLTFVLVIVFLMGGSSRSDVQSLAILNPLMVLCCGAAMFMLGRERLQEKKSLIASFVLIFILTGLYLTPMPQEITGFSRGADDFAQIREAVGVTDTSQLLAISPSIALQSLFFLFGPMAVLLFAIQLNRDELRLTLPIIIVAGAACGIIGVLQVVGGADGPFYFYRITNYGSAVGLFANRNHAAVFLACQFPILALFAVMHPVNTRRTNKALKPITIAIAAILVPLILITGSRSGLLTAIVALLGGALLYASTNHPNRETKNRPFMAPLLAIAFVSCLVLITIFVARAEAIDRIFEDTNDGNSRVDYWASSLNLFWHYFPFGSGPGSFVSAFQKNEPVTLLGRLYLNRLHNDWLETGLTFGLAGIFLMLGGILYYLRRSFLLWFRMDGARSAVSRGRMASIIFAILGIASLSDYPLRTPAMMGFAALVLLWFAEARREPKVTADSPG